MTIFARLSQVLALLSLVAAAACGVKGGEGIGGPPPADADDYVELTRAVHSLGQGIDPEEGERLAKIALDYTHELAVRYQITDSPLVHNTKVNMGLKPRGLCKDWADDLEARLRQEGFRTIRFHRAIANTDVAFRIEHSTVIISGLAEDMFAGLVLDPWRNGGILHWTRTLEDDHYRWIPRNEVFAMKMRWAERDVSVTRSEN